MKFLLIFIIVINTGMYEFMSRIFGEDTYKTTAYSLSVESCNKTKKHKLYGITYSGKRVEEGLTVSVDPKVIPIGTWIMIDNRLYQAQDTGSGVKGKHIDIYVADDGQARRYGVKYKNIIVMR